MELACVVFIPDPRGVAWCIRWWRTVRLRRGQIAIQEHERYHPRLAHDVMVRVVVAPHKGW